MIELPAAFDRLDDAIDVWWDRFRDRPVLDRIYYTASEAADFSLMWHALGVVQAIIEDDPMIAIGISGALGIESALVNGPIKAVFKRNRPTQDGPRPHTLRQPRTSSFPSGHASAAMVAAALLSRHAGGVAWYAVGAVVATSRIHVRIHHASDVAGGVAVGALLGVVARRILA
jgi:membrane-associated phospholipid phosphatase